MRGSAARWPSALTNDATLPTAWSGTGSHRPAAGPTFPSPFRGDDQSQRTVENRGRKTSRRHAGRHRDKNNRSWNLFRGSRKRTDCWLGSRAFLSRRLPHRPRVGGIRFENYAEPKRTPPVPASPPDRRRRRRSGGEAGTGAPGNGCRLVAKPASTGTGPVGTMRMSNIKTDA